MRKWLALIMGTAALAFAGTALGLAGSSEADVVEKPTTTTTKVEYTYDLDFAVPKGLLVEDDLPSEKPGPPVDDTPPEIVILHPEDGQVFERNEVVLEGETEPGAKVFIGDRAAEVSETGAWRIVVELEKGENTLEVKAVDAAENVGSDTVTVVYRAPEPKKEEPKKEQPKKEEPKEEPPKDDDPKDDKPKEEPPAEWEFVAKQVFGECAENPPYDVFHGTGKPGTLVHIESAYGGGTAEIGEKGHWEIKVIFETAPVGEVFAVHVADEFANHKVFEFVHTE